MILVLPHAHNYNIMHQWFTSSSEVQLPAHNNSFRSIPEIITDSSPTVLIANLHSAFIGCETSNKTNVTIQTR